jgi:hypothetical protein
VLVEFKGDNTLPKILLERGDRLGKYGEGWAASLLKGIET